MQTTITTTVALFISCCPGQVTFCTSLRTSLRKLTNLSINVPSDLPFSASFAVAIVLNSFAFHFNSKIINHENNWQPRRDSNPQHPVLETGALAIRATGLQNSPVNSTLILYAKSCCYMSDSISCTLRGRNAAFYSWSCNSSCSNNQNRKA